MQIPGNVASRLCALFAFLLTVSLFAQTPPPKAKSEGQRYDFVLDPNRPFAYLRFDHIGAGQRRWKDEPDLRIWLWLTNNCKAPISVNTFSVPDGSPKDEQGVMDMIVASNPYSGPVLVDKNGAVYPKPFKKATAEELPREYWFEVGSLQIIPPGRALFFSVPINHVGPRWFFEIPFQFDTAEGKFPRDPRVSMPPNMKFQYQMFDLPPEAQQEVQRWYDSQNSQ